MLNGRLRGGVLGLVCSGQGGIDRWEMIVQAASGIYEEARVWGSVLAVYIFWKLGFFVTLLLLVSERKVLEIDVLKTTMIIICFMET